MQRMASSQIDAVADMWSAAFLDDPGYASILPDAHRQHSLRVLFAALLRMRQRAGVPTWVTGPSRGPTGAITAAPSTVHYGLLDQLRAGLFAAPFTWGWDATMRMRRADLHIGATRIRHRPTVPHTWVPQLGVHPDHHGRGIGTRLLQRVLDDVDALRQPIALGTTAPDNPSWYARFGFEQRARESIEAGGFDFWLLVRPAVPGQADSAITSQ